jgi:hypothetical protein
MKKLFLILLSFYFTNSNAQIDIFQAVRDNNVIEIENYLKKNGDVNAINSKSHSLLILASYNDAFETVQLLLHYKADATIQDNTGNTALMGASFKGYTKVAELLLLNGSNPNMLNFNQANALFFAVTFGHPDIAKMLLSYNTNLNQKDRFGKTVLDHAFIQGNQEMIDLLNSD